MIDDPKIVDEKWMRFARHGFRKTIKERFVTDVRAKNPDMSVYCQISIPSRINVGV